MAANVTTVSEDEALWLRQIDPTRIPRHVAIIMDGNGRWAQQQHLPRVAGHVRGSHVAREIILACRRLRDKLLALGQAEPGQCGRVTHLTLYTFSAENWSRPQDEVSGLMRLIEEQLHGNLAELQSNGVRVRLLGRDADLPVSLRDELSRDIQATADNEDMDLYLALNYGGRRELADAARQLAELAVAGQLDPADIDEPLFARQLYAPDTPDPELLIRTGGDLRVSNFLLWQIAYAEFWVTPTLWPSFSPAQVYQAIAEYQGRERRFGGLNNNGNT